MICLSVTLVFVLVCKITHTYIYIFPIYNHVMQIICCQFNFHWLDFDPTLIASPICMKACQETSAITGVPVKWSLKRYHFRRIRFVPMNDGKCEIYGDFFRHYDFLYIFSCPEQLNRWPCHSLSQSVTDLLILEHKTIYCLERMTSHRLEQDIWDVFWQFFK